MEGTTEFDAPFKYFSHIQGDGRTLVKNNMQGIRFTVSRIPRPAGFKPITAKLRKKVFSLIFLIYFY